MIRDKMQVLELKAGEIKENAKLLNSVYQWLSSDETYLNTARFGDITPVIQALVDKRRVGVAQLKITFNAANVTKIAGND